MSSVSSLNSASALLFLQNASRSSAMDRREAAPGPSLVEVANGAAGNGGSVNGAAGAESAFDPKAIDVTEMKTRLFERLGEKLGISMDDFEKMSDFGRAIRDAVNALKKEPDGYLVLAKIADELGLDELGISLDTLVEAVVDPDGDADDRLEAALAGMVDDDAADALAALRGLGLDEIGRYGF